MSTVRRKLNGAHGDKGGYFGLYLIPHSCEGPTDLVTIFEGWVGGLANFYRTEQCKRCAREKSRRLLKRYLEYKEVNSVIYHDSHKKNYGGAIILLCKPSGAGEEYQQFLFSFSGFTEQLDEAVIFMTPYFADWEVEDFSATQVLLESGNPLSAQFYREWFG